MMQPPVANDRCSKMRDKSVHLGYQWGCFAFPLIPTASLIVSFQHPQPSGRMTGEPILESETT